MDIDCSSTKKVRLLLAVSSVIGTDVTCLNQKSASHSRGVIAESYEDDDLDELLSGLKEMGVVKVERLFLGCFRCQRMNHVAVECRSHSTSMDVDLWG